MSTYRFRKDRMLSDFKGPHKKAASECGLTLHVQRQKREKNKQTSTCSECLEINRFGIL
jgi:hypothetical protein